MPKLYIFRCIYFSIDCLKMAIDLASRKYILPTSFLLNPQSAIFIYFPLEY